MLSINTNLSSYVAQRSLSNSTKLLNQAIERMTTGYKINHASDNSANFSISTNMSSKLSSYQVAEDNASMGLDLLLTAEDTMDIFSNNLMRLRSLSTQALNGTYGKDSLKAINTEVKALVNEMYRVKNEAEYNGQKIFGESAIDNQTCGAKGLEVNGNGFLQDIEERDTSQMTKLASVSESNTLAKGVYSISTAEELAKLARMQADGKIADGSEFVLGADIDLSGYSSGEGWEPIGGILGTAGAGRYQNGFSGIFDGNGHMVTGLEINRKSVSCCGLFGFVTGATIKNLGVSGVVNGGENTGGLVGVIRDGGTIENCFSKVDVTSFVVHAGGLAGCITTQSIVNNSYATGNVITDNMAGGLVGTQGEKSTISNSFATGDVNVLGADATPQLTGGLVGQLSNSSKIDNCFATGDVTGIRYVGGLCGGPAYGSNVITNSHSTGNVYSQSEKAGGLLGGAHHTLLCENCYATGDVVTETQWVGGLIGFLSDSGTFTITNCFSTGDVKGANNAGGLLGYLNSGTLSLDNCYSIGNITATGDYAGGLVGYSLGSISINNSYATGNISGNNYVGGILGRSSRNLTIENTYSTGNITGNNYVGGICGYTSTGNTLTNCYIKGTIYGAGQYVGGIVGNSNSATITKCSVLGISDDLKGVIAGSSSGKISNCRYDSYYEQNNIKLVGAGSATIEDCSVIEGDEAFNLGDKIFTFQVGIDGNYSSELSVNTSFNFGNLKNVIYIGIENSKTLDIIDKLTNQLSEKQVTFGASQNRLESALEEISIHYENLTSSRSTLRDADIAKVSSQYIRQQILQQASATLLATANQSPSIALQLI